MGRGGADFRAATKRILAARVGYRCSFKGCKRPTIGPSDESVEAVALLGEAAHIIAASTGPGARRVDPSKTDEELRSIENGIWLCRHHHGLVDADEATFTAEELRRYKAAAEAEAKARLSREPKLVSVAGANRPDAKLVLTRPEARLLSVSDPSTAVELLNPAALALDLVGRFEELEHLRQWLGSEPLISVHGVVGDGGMGKTRLALELCRLARAVGWDAGFLDAAEMDRFQKLQNLSEWGWSRPTLIVVDYAATRVDALYAWLSELPGERESSDRLRILLLERSAEAQQGWWPRVFHRGSFADDPLRKLRHANEPVRLGPIRDAEDRRQIFEAMCRRLGDNLEQGLDEAIEASLQRLTLGGYPLFLMMAAATTVELGLRRTLALRPDELAFRVAERELKRIDGFADGNKSLEKLLRHLAAVSTLCQGLSEDELDAVVRLEKETLGLDNAGDPATILDSLRRALPAEGRAVRPIQPDLVGEAVVLLVLNELSEAKARGAVLRASALDRRRVVPFVLRLVQDYATSSQHCAVEWTEALGREALETAELKSFVNQMPETTVVLRGLAAEMTGFLLERCRAEETNQAELAGICNNLANRLSDLGRREEALERAEEAVELYGALAPERPEAFRPALAMSLNNLANRLSELGRREEALERAEEAVELYRALAAERPEAFRPDLASALNNLAISLSELGRQEEALERAEEAVELYRALAAERPEAFRPALASALNNLANRLSDLGRREEALERAEEAVETLRPFFLHTPMAFAQWMGVMARVYLGLCEELETAPDAELLGPIAEVFQRLQSEG